MKPLAVVIAERSLLTQRRITFAPACGLRRAELRPLPFPFTAYCTIASDADSSHLDAMESTGRIIRETYGLPVADSFFPHFFYKLGFAPAPEGKVDAGLARQRGDRPQSDDFDLTRFVGASAGWMRRFHQGWYDTVHGWLLRIQIRIGDDFSAGAKTGRTRAVELSAARSFVQRAVRKIRRDLPPSIGGSRHRFNFRIPSGWHIRVPPRYFVAEYRNPTPHNTVLLRFLDGTRSVGEVRLECTAGAPQALVPYTIDLFEAVGTDPELLNRIDAELIITGEIGGIEVRNAQLVSWLRADIAEQTQVFEAFNLRASVYTSHGGGYNIGYGKAPTLDAADPRGAAENPSTVHYALDLFRDYGVEFFNTATNTSQGEAKDIREVVFRKVLNNGDVVYDFYRYLDWNPDKPSPDGSFATGLGAQIERLLDVSREPWSGGIVYTHCYSKPPNDPERTDRSVAGLFNEATHRGLARLAASYFGTEPDAGAQRVFVAPTSAIVRYSQAIDELPHRSWVGADGNTVRIESWIDPVTGKRVPEPSSVRQLRFATFYVRDAGAARVFVDGGEIADLIRNPADDTGSESVTIADTETPTLIAGRVPLTERGDLQVEANGLEIEPGEGGTRLRFGGAQGALTLRPTSISLANHSAVCLRIEGDLEGAALRLAIEDEDGLVLAAAERAGKGALHIKRGPDRMRQTWVLPFHALVAALPPGKRRYPVGKVSKVLLSLEGSRGADFLLRELSLLRDDDRPRSDGFTVGGRVPADSGIAEVRMAAAGPTVSTPVLPSGDFVFLDKAPRGIARIEGIKADGSVQLPLAGASVEIVRDTMEVDFA